MVTVVFSSSRPSVLKKKNWKLAKAVLHDLLDLTPKRAHIRKLTLNSEYGYGDTHRETIEKIKEECPAVSEMNRGEVGLMQLLDRLEEADMSLAKLVRIET